MRGIVSCSALVVRDSVREPFVASNHLLPADTFFESQAVDDFLQLGIDDGMVVGETADEGDGVASCGQVAMTCRPPEEERT